jgi:adiponectin receptor
MYVTLNPEYATVEYRKLRTGVFISLGCMGIVPAFHHVLRYGLMMAIESFALLYVLFMGALYLVGAFIYASRIPERWFPGAFDIVGHSHQIWHMLVLTAAAVHMCGVIKVFHWWHDHNPSCHFSDNEMRLWFA